MAPSSPMVFVEVVHRPSNLSALKRSLPRLGFSFGCGDLFLEVLLLDFPGSACNLGIKILEVRNWSSW